MCTAGTETHMGGATGVPDKPKRAKRARLPPPGLYDNWDAADPDAEDPWGIAMEDILEDEDDDDEVSEDDYEWERLDVAVLEYARAMAKSRGSARDHLPTALRERARTLMERGASH